MTHDAIADAAEGHIWDVVVIGTGAGGASCGYALARQGRSVIFLERGKAADTDASVVRGVPFAGGDDDAALRYGWWPQPFYRKYGDRALAARQPIGCATGGSTATFGMVMDRLRPSDFTPRRFFSSAGANLPEAWPVGADEFAPYYAAAERLYRVRGTTDPLGGSDSPLLDPPAPTAKETALLERLTDSGLHPYRIHYAQDRVPGCEGCPAMLCAKGCRNDAAKICLRPAIDQYGARLVDQCRVVRLEEDQRRVARAICQWRGREIAVRGRVFVLAANAFATPALLLRSATSRFPDGLANSSGLVGRNLMLHVSDFLVARMKRQPRDLSPDMHHGLAFNDFYLRDGVKLGNVHIHSVPVTQDAVLSFMRLHMKRMARLPPAVQRAVASAGAHVARSGFGMATIVEDLPYMCNRVLPRADSLDALGYEYRYPHELRVRSWTLLQHVRESLKQRFFVRLARPAGLLNVAHACGTCRFGDDPKASVLDRDNRAHDLDNLYVVDASFFPSSGGINPSLTIVANSLRVGEQIDRRL